MLFVLKIFCILDPWRAGIAAQTGMDLIPAWINLLKIQLAFLVSIHFQLR